MASSADSRGMLYATWHKIQSVDPKEVKDYNFIYIAFSDLYYVYMCLNFSFGSIMEIEQEQTSRRPRTTVRIALEKGCFILNQEHVKAVSQRDEVTFIIQFSYQMICYNLFV